MQIMTRRVHVYETDVMGIVHHSNYIRFCEEARVRFCEKFELLDLQVNHNEEAVHGLTVIGLRFDYKKPLRFHDEFFIEIQGQQIGIKLILQYKIFKKTLTHPELCVVAQTDHCSLSQELKVQRPTKQYLAKTKELPWTETWL